ncbi:MAG: cytidylate kinase-like family protein [Chloroflexi bacterium]|nr:cytidylate kinase-like family protein [Chloroflexota bacterium]
MNVITINGQIGTGGPEIGNEVARRLGYEYVDRLILAEAAQRLGATVAVLREKERRVPTARERIARFLQTVMERSAASGAMGDPYFGPGLAVLLGEEYPELAKEPITSADQVHDQRFIEVTQAVIKELASKLNVVINGRASNLILKDLPDAFHVGLVSSGMDSRIKVIMTREGVSAEEAARMINEHEKARVTYFRKFFKASPYDPTLYHIMIDAHRLGPNRVATAIISAAGH